MSTLTLRKTVAVEPETLEQWALKLEAAATFRVGQMDSQSRVEEIIRSHRNTLIEIASEMRLYT